MASAEEIKKSLFSSSLQTQAEAKHNNNRHTDPNGVTVYGVESDYDESGSENDEAQRADDDILAQFRVGDWNDDDDSDDVEDNLAKYEFRNKSGGVVSAGTGTNTQGGQTTAKVNPSKMSNNVLKRIHCFGEDDDTSMGGGGGGGGAGGNGGTTSAKLNQKVVNELRDASKTATGKRHDVDRSERATTENVMDPRTRLILYKMANSGLLWEIHGCVSTGKEANVYYALDGDQKDVAIKIFKTSILVFKDREKYISGEHRFQRFCKSNPRKMVRTWAEKEARNLTRLKKGGLNVPGVKVLRQHVLIMDFIGTDGWPAPRLKDVRLTVSKLEKLYFEVCLMCRDMWQKCRLVHGDLSEFNLLFHEGKVVMIDVSQSVEMDHPYATEFLRRDLLNMNHFFRSKGVTALMTLLEFYLFVTNVSVSIPASSDVFKAAAEAAAAAEAEQQQQAATAASSDAPAKPATETNTQEGQTANATTATPQATAATPTTTATENQNKMCTPEQYIAHWKDSWRERPFIEAEEAKHQKQLAEIDEEVRASKKKSKRKAARRAAGEVGDDDETERNYDSETAVTQSVADTSALTTHSKKFGRADGKKRAGVFNSLAKPLKKNQGGGSAPTALNLQQQDAKMQEKSGAARVDDSFFMNLPLPRRLDQVDEQKKNRSADVQAFVDKLVTGSRGNANDDDGAGSESGEAGSSSGSSSSGSSSGQGSDSDEPTQKKRKRGKGVKAEDPEGPMSLEEIMDSLQEKIERCRNNGGTVPLSELSKEEKKIFQKMVKDEKKEQRANKLPKHLKKRACKGSKKK